MPEDWLDRWSSGRIGWHEAQGNSGLKKHWPSLGAANSVLVPLCGKSADLAWLARRGHDVIGVELSAIAIRDFFNEQGLTAKRRKAGEFECFECRELPISLYQGDYFSFEAAPCGALYDRGALVALQRPERQRYVNHTDGLLLQGAAKLVITLEYDQSIVQGPPYSVVADELHGYWADLQRASERDDLETCPPKFRAAGLTEIREVCWTSAGSAA